MAHDASMVPNNIPKTKAVHISAGMITFTANTVTTIYHHLGTTPLIVFFEPCAATVVNNTTDEGITDWPAMCTKAATLFTCKCTAAKTFNWIALA